MSKLEKNPRYVAIQALLAVINGRSLSDVVADLGGSLGDSDRRFVQHLLFGTLRQFDALEDRVNQMLKKPIKPSEMEVKLAHYLAAYELTEMATAEHALLNNWVNLIKLMNKPWAAGLTNAILRRIQRGEFPKAKSESGRYNLPLWLLKRLRNAWGEEHLESIATFFQLHPEMILRVNLSKTTREEYLSLLKEEGIEALPHTFVESAIVLEQAVRVEALPHFFEGWVSIQDAAPQLASILLAPPKGGALLDACAAPGGKTSALLEQFPELKRIVALDSSAERLAYVEDNLTRIFGAKPEAVQLIASTAQTFTSDLLFDSILLDVPCSATGIMHRQPDIKRHRRAKDIEALRLEQREILNHAWSLLKPNGRLLYATCSILKEENEQQIRHFMKQHTDAIHHPLNLPFGIEEEFGTQILPLYFEQERSLDGFYYALLEKRGE